MRILYKNNKNIKKKFNYWKNYYKLVKINGKNKKNNYHIKMMILNHNYINSPKHREVLIKHNGHLYLMF